MNTFLALVVIPCSSLKTLPFFLLVQSRNLSNVLGSDDMTAKLSGGGADAAADDDEDDDVPVAGSASEGEESEEEEEEEGEEEEAGGAEDSVSALENAWDCEYHFTAC